MEKEGKVTKVCCILNPISGKGRSAKAVYGPDSFIGTGTLIYPTQSFKDAMAEINPDIEFVIKETERRGHAVELAEEYANQGYAIIGAGGDGTLGEVVQGLIKCKYGLKNPCGFVSCGTQNFFSIACGIMEPKQVCELIKTSTTNPISVFSLTDGENGNLEDTLGSVQLHFGMPVRAVAGQDYGRTHIGGPAVWLKLFAINTVLNPNKNGNNVHCKITITTLDDKVVEVEGKFIWIIVNQLNPLDGTNTENSYISYCMADNFCGLPRFVKTIKDPMEFIGGVTRTMQDSHAFKSVTLEPLGYTKTSKNGKWICVLDGDNIEVDGTLKVVAKKNFIERFFVEREPKRDARFLPKRHGPMGPAQQEHHKRISGGEVLKIDSGAIRGKIIGCCFFLLIAIVIVILFSLGIIS